MNCPLSIPYKVDNTLAFAGLNRNDCPKLRAMVSKDATISLKRLWRLFIPEVRLKRQIGFMAKHSIQGENWKAWI